MTTYAGLFAANSRSIIDAKMGRPIVIPRLT